MSAQMELPRRCAFLPIDPRSLLGTEPIERGQLYNDANLDSWQRQAAEQALRMVLAGTYPEAAP